MISMILAAAFFLFIHLAISGTRLRDGLIARLGEGGYMGAFSIASLIGIAWLAMAYNDFSASPDNIYFWTLPAWLYHAGSLAMLIAMLFAVIGATTNGPTQVEAMIPADSYGEPKGIHRITRHPFLWGVLIWSAFHFAINGDLASILLFGTFFVLTALGTRSIDHKRARLIGDKWTGYAAQTSNIPFAAQFKGQHLGRAFAEIGWWQWIAAIAAFGVLFYAHLWLFQSRRSRAGSPIKSAQAARRLRRAMRLVLASLVRACLTEWTQVQL